MALPSQADRVRAPSLLCGTALWESWLPALQALHLQNQNNTDLAVIRGGDKKMHLEELINVLDTTGSISARYGHSILSFLLPENVPEDF